MSAGTQEAGDFPLREAPAVSVVIRSREEERYLRALITLLKRQTISDIEIILVIDYSRFETLGRLRRLPIDRLIPLSHDNFSHAYSTNLGVAVSRGELVAITNGHSLPISDKWLKAGVRHFDNPKVAGVTGLSMPVQDGSVWEKLYFSPVRLEMYRKRWLHPLLQVISPYFFSISTINCMIRRSLWEIYAFDESLQQCEDYDWGVEMRARGYLTPVDPDFSVYHSHGDGLKLFLTKLKQWEVLTRSIAQRVRPRSSYTRAPLRALATEPQDLVSIAPS